MMRSRCAQQATAVWISTAPHRSSSKFFKCLFLFVTLKDLMNKTDLEASHDLSSLHFIPSWQRAAMPGPETPPRYRYTKSGDSDDEAKESDAKNKVGKTDRFDKAQAAVLTSRKRSGSLGRPLCMSRVLDRQRHGGEVPLCEQSQASQGEPRKIRGWSEAPRRFVLQAPPLLKLGHLQTPVLPDPLNSFGMPGKVQNAYPGSEGVGASQTAFVPPAPPAPPVPALGNPFGGPCGPCGPFPFQPTPSFDLRAAASRRSLSTGRSFPSAPSPAVAPMPLGAPIPPIPPVGITPRPGGFPYHGGLQQPQGLNLFNGAMSVPTPTRARRDSEEHCRKDRREMEERESHLFKIPQTVLLNCQLKFEINNFNQRYRES